MKKFIIKYVGILSISVLIVGIGGLLAKLLGISIQEMLIYMLVGEYANRVYDDIFG